MRKYKIAAMLAALAGVGLPVGVRADIPIRADRIMDGLSKPLFVAAAPGDDTRLFIVEQAGGGTLASSGVIRILDKTTGLMNADPFLVIPNITVGNEQGLLGLAFHPNYATNGKFYVNLSASGGGASGQTQIRQYNRLTLNTADAGTFTNILSYNQPQTNHNGGWLGFSPNDGFLYIASGDGGNSNDTGTGHTSTIGNAQDKSNLLGKMLRIDVTSTPDAGKNYKIPPSNPFAGATAGADEIWSYGLRNPWRNSFDRATGDLYIGDVGQDASEEVDFQPASSAGGENYGWRAREGLTDTGLLPVPAGVTNPIHVYPNPADGIAVTGGYVYRGSENETLEGTYFFADYGRGRVWTFRYDGATKTDFRELTDKLIYVDSGTDINQITSFGEDNQGRLYITDRDGDVFQLIPAKPGDANLDDIVNIADLRILAANFQASGKLWANADFTDDGTVDRLDLQLLARYWQQGTGASLAIELAALGLPVDVVPEPAMIAALVLPMLMMRRRRSGCYSSGDSCRSEKVNVTCSSFNA